MIARRPKSGVTPSDVQEVRRRFHDIIREAAYMAEAPSKHARAPFSVPAGSTSEKRTARAY